MLGDTELRILNISDILPNRFQPRLKFEQDSLEQLAVSISKFGVIEPIVVRPVGKKFEIIAGERRYKASKLASKSTIPAIIINLSDKDSEELALLENVQRQSLNPIEEAVSYKRILDLGYITREELAKKIGKPQVLIFNKIKLLSLSDEVQSYLLNGKISEGHARSLLKITNLDAQSEMLHRIVNERLTVKQTDKEIRKMLEADTFLDKEKLETLELDERSKLSMDLDKIMREAKDINAPVSTEVKEGPNLMASGNLEQNNSVVTENPAPVPVNNNDNKFVNMASGLDQPVVDQPSSNANLNIDNMFNKPIDNLANNLPFGTINTTEVQSTPVDAVSSVTSTQPQSQVSNISSVVADAFNGVNVTNDVIVSDNSKFINIPDTNIQEPDVAASNNLTKDYNVENNFSENSVGQSNNQSNVINSLGSNGNNSLASSGFEVPFSNNSVSNSNNVNVEPQLNNLMNNEISNSVGQETTSMNNVGDFAKIVQMLRDCANQIEKNGHFVNVDEMDLGSQYKVTITIDK